MSTSLFQWGSAGRYFAGALIVTSSVLVSSVAVSDSHQNAAQSLEPTQEHQQATEIIVHLMQRYHYKPVRVDDNLSEQIFDRYLESLDPQKSFLLASDIEAFIKFRQQLDDALQNEELDPIFDIFNTFRERMDERAQFAKRLLKRQFDFTVDESYEFNRDDAPWMHSQESMNELWRKRVKNDILNLRLVEQTNDEIIETLDNRYTRMARRVQQLSANDVFQLFINAYTQSVEPHSAYFSPRNSENFNINMSLSLEGIGTALRTENEYTVVQRVIAGGPAALSEKISADDRIVGVGNGEDAEIVDIVSWPLQDVVDLIRGPKGSVVRLQILPIGAPAGTTPEIVTLVRDKIKLEEQAAKESVLEIDGAEKTRRIGVIDLPTFYLDSAARAEGAPDYRSTTRDVSRLLDKLMNTDGGVDGIVLDLRGNGGGSLVEAGELTGLFIEDGPIVQIKEATGEVNALDDENPAVVYAGPIAILVDRYSASASEIVAAAIQDYGRGIVLGEPTFGKGTVQRVVPLDREGKLGQLKLTTAQFFRVNGEGTQHRGVIPDIVFPTAMDSVAHGERQFDNALAWAEVTATDYDVWSEKKPDYEQLKSQHESRYRSSEWFDLLLDELNNQRADDEELQVSLVETVREQENAERQTDREKRLQLFRTAFGASSIDDTDSENEEDNVPDIILEEASKVLLDTIDRAQ